MDLAPEISSIDQGSRCCEEWGPAAAMLAVDVALGFMNVLVKLSLDEGMNCLVLITLRQLVAAVFLAPFAYARERKTRPKLTGRALILIFFSALLGASLMQYLFFLGLRYTSATFACAFINMVPVFTFLIALPLGLEKLNLRTAAGRAKLAATALCVAGVAVLMAYKGAALTPGHGAATIPHVPASSTATANSMKAGHAAAVQWTLGSVALLGACLCWSLWFLVQANVNKAYPAIYTSTTIMSFLGFLQAAALALATARRGSLALWVVQSKIQIVTVVYAGVVGSGVGFFVMTWCVRKRGPVFTSTFSPLIQVVVAIIDVSFLHEPLHLGSVLGSVLVIMGLYLLLWGKSKEAPARNSRGDANKPAVQNSCAVAAAASAGSPVEQV